MTTRESRIAEIEERLSVPYVMLSDIETIRWLLSELRAADEREAALREALENLVAYFPTRLPSLGVLPNREIEAARAALASGSEKA